MKSFQEQLHDRNIHIATRYYGTNDLATGWEIRGIVDNKDLFSDLYSQYPLTTLDTLDDYVYSPEFASYEDVGRSNIRFLMGDDEADVLLPCIRLTDYGKAVAEHDHMILTGYGGIERRDGQPILTQEQELTQDTLTMQQL